MDIPTTSREVHLAQRPHGWPDASTFELVETRVPDVGDGQVLVVNDYLSVDPYMRGRMDDRPSYVPPYAVGEVMDGGAVGTVVASKADGVPVGASVVHGAGWREVSLVDAGAARVVDVDAAPASAYLGVLGMTGLTAWVGLTRIARVREGDVVLVSGAAGAVGSVAGQLARMRGASRVVGSAGSADKVAYLTGELGFDAAFDYHRAPVAEQLAEAAPKGVDVYFDNVGGDHLEAAIGAFRRGGRGALCGAVSAYNATEPPPGPRNLSRLVGTRSRLEGFIVSDHDDAMPEFLATAVPALDDGSLVMDETVVDGISHASEAFVSMLCGGNTGKMVVRLT